MKGVAKGRQEIVLVVALCLLCVFTGTLCGCWWSSPWEADWKQSVDAGWSVWGAQSWANHTKVYAAAERSFPCSILALDPWQSRTTHLSTMQEEGSKPVKAVFSHSWSMLGLLGGRMGTCLIFKCWRFGVALTRFKGAWASAGQALIGEKSEYFICNLGERFHGFTHLLLYSPCSLQLHVLFISLWAGINQRARPGPPVVVDKQLAAIRACSTESLSGGCSGGNRILLVLTAALKLNKKLDLPFSVSLSASNLPDQDSRFQEMSSLSCRSEFTGTKSLERSSNKLSWSFGLLPWRENWGGLYLPELRRELTSVSESRRECLSRSIASLGWELDLRGVETGPSFDRKRRRNSKKTGVHRGVVLWRTPLLAGQGRWW